MHPRRHRDRLDPTPTQLRRFRAEHQTALPLVQIRTQHRIPACRVLAGQPLIRHTTTVETQDPKTPELCANVTSHSMPSGIGRSPASA
jgi:hypothetical protein